MKNSFKANMGLLADLIQIVGGIIIAIDWIRKNLGIFSGNLNFLPVGLIVLAALSIMVYTATSSFIDKFKRKIRTEKIENQAAALEATTSMDLSKLLPSTALMVLWNKEISEQAKAWAHDAKLFSHNVYFKQLDDGFSLMMQAAYHSELKSADITIYLPSKKYSPDIREADERFEHSYLPEIFFKKFPRWREATLLAYEAVKDHLPKIDLALNSHREDMGIWFEYTQAKMIKTDNFEYDGTNLKNLKNGKASPVGR